jgi:hypothetical protein
MAVNYINRQAGRQLIGYSIAYLIAAEKLLSICLTVIALAAGIKRLGIVDWRPSHWWKGV